MSLRESNKTQRRLDIVAAARAIVEEEGVTALSTRRLAQRAGVSLATLYNLIGSKAAILRAMIAAVVDELDQSLQTLTSAQPLALSLAVVSHSVDIYVAKKASLKPVLKARLHMASSMDEQSIIGPGYRPWKLQFDAVSEAQAQGLLRPELSAELVANEILRSFSACMQDWVLGLLSDQEFAVVARYSTLYNHLAAVTAEQFPISQQQLIPIQDQALTCLQRLLQPPSP